MSGLEVGAWVEEVRWSVVDGVVYKLLEDLIPFDSDDDDAAYQSSR